MPIAHLSLAAFIIIISTLRLFSARREPPFMVFSLCLDKPDLVLIPSKVLIFPCLKKVLIPTRGPTDNHSYRDTRTYIKTERNTWDDDHAFSNESSCPIRRLRIRQNITLSAMRQKKKSLVNHGWLDARQVNNRLRRRCRWRRRHRRLPNSFLICEQIHDYCLSAERGNSKRGKGSYVRTIRKAQFLDAFIKIRLKKT